jgi:hypothetical protein
MTGIPSQALAVHSQRQSVRSRRTLAYKSHARHAGKVFARYDQSEIIHASCPHTVQQMNVFLMQLIYSMLTRSGVGMVLVSAFENDRTKEVVAIDQIGPGS